MINLTDNYSVDITICGNAETLCDSYDLGPWREEATVEACDAACDVIRKEMGDAPEVNSIFRDWHGGRFDQFWERFGFVAVRFNGKLPDDLYEKVEAACWRAHGKMELILEKWQEKNLTDCES